MFHHVSVLLKETIDGLNIKEDGVYVDCTMGGAGHSKEIVKRLSKDGLFIGFDQDKNAIATAKERLAEYSDRVRFVHSNFSNIKEELETNNISINNINKIKVVPYIYNMEEIMNCVDVIVARSGAMTITEISNLGKPSILVPLPNVSHDHQLYNAKVLEDINAAKIILDSEMKEDKLNRTIEEIILDKNRVKEMGNNALKISTNDVEEKIYNEVKKLTK